MTEQQQPGPTWLVCTAGCGQYVEYDDAAIKALATETVARARAGGLYPIPPGPVLCEIALQHSALWKLDQLGPTHHDSVVTVWVMPSGEERDRFIEAGEQMDVSPVPRATMVVRAVPPHLVAELSHEG